MTIAKVKCPKCGAKFPKKMLKKTHGKCSKCGFPLSTSLTRFSSARSRIRSKYGR